MNDRDPSMQETTRRKSTSPLKRQRRRVVKIAWSPDRAAIGREVLLDGPPFEAGREAEGPGHVLDDCMSRQHFSVARGVTSSLEQIKDLESKNGTFVDGARWQKACPAQPGTVIAAGDSLFVIDQEIDPHLLPSAPDADDGLAKELIGSACATQGLRRSIATVAKTDRAVLLLGPTGAGKEVAAQAIHRLSGRSGPFIAKNSAGIPETIADAEFFGIAEGVASGVRAREGCFAQAHGGTLFLDEIGDLPLPLQAKILRVLQDGIVQPLGGEPRRVDVRVVAATNRDLTGTGFREDLRARLAQWELHLSPLKDRRADVLPLWGFFYGKAAPGRAAMRASPEFLEALVLHDWPTNVRELKTLAEKLSVLVGPDEILDLHHLPEVIQQRIGDREEPWMSDSDSGPDDTLDPRKVPRERLEALLKQYAGNVSEVARALGLYREQVYRRCRHYGLDPGQFR